MKFSKLLPSWTSLILFLLVSFSSQIAHANLLTDWQDRKYVRETWNVTSSEASSKQIDALLNSKYPGTNVTWRALIYAVQSTDAVVQEARQNRTEAALDKAIEFAKKKPVEFAVNKALDKLNLSVVGEAYGIYQVLQNVSVVANKTAMLNQIKLYQYARQEGISHRDIVNQTAGGVLFDDSGKGWIVGLEFRNAPISYAGKPVNTTAGQTWQIAKFLWDMKANPNSFYQEKNRIGGQLHNAFKNSKPAPPKPAPPKPTPARPTTTVDPVTSIMASLIGESFWKSVSYFKNQGYRWERQHDNRYDIYVAKKGNVSFTCQFARREDNNAAVCELIYADARGKSFSSLAPSNWQGYETYIIRDNVLMSNRESNNQVVLLKRGQKGGRLRWQFDLDASTSSIQTKVVERSATLTVTSSWPSAKVISTYSVELAGVPFKRNFSGEAEDIEVDDSHYFVIRNNTDGRAIRWKQGDKTRVEHFGILKGHD